MAFTHNEDMENTNPTLSNSAPSEPQTPQPVVTPSLPATHEQYPVHVASASPKHLPMIAAAVGLVVLVGALGFYFGKQKSTAVAPLIPVTPLDTPQILVQPSPEAVVAQSTDSAMPKTGFQFYTNTAYGYEFQYPTQTVNPCEDGSCVLLPTSGVRVDAYSLSGTESIKEQLLSADLFCSADGPTGSISCKNTAVEDYVSGTGAVGYKVTRTSTNVDNVKTITIKNEQDEAYYFALEKPFMNEYGVKYTGVIFTAIDHEPLQVTALREVVSTFKKL